MKKKEISLGVSTQCIKHEMFKATLELEVKNDPRFVIFTTKLAKD
jgi:hypothetical protein